MSRATSLPGAELFLKTMTFFEQATCPGQLRCLGHKFFSKKFFFEQATCHGQLGCLGQNLFSTNVFSLNRPLVPGSSAAWGRTFSQNQTFLLNKPLVPGSFAAWGGTFAQFFFCEQATCPGQLRCLGQNCFFFFFFFFSKYHFFFGTSHLSRAASLPGAELFLKK